MHVKEATGGPGTMGWIVGATLLVVGSAAQAVVWQDIKGAGGEIAFVIGFILAMAGLLTLLWKIFRAVNRFVGAMDRVDELPAQVTEIQQTLSRLEDKHE